MTLFSLLRDPPCGTGLPRCVGVRSVCISEDYLLAQANNNEEVTRSSASQKGQLEFDETEMVETEKSINHDREHVKKTTELTESSTKTQL